MGDGSGSNWTRESGWCSVSIERATHERRLWYGCMNSGTVNFAEMMAYLQPLNWYASVELNRRHKRGGVKFRNVHIITDSKYCNDQGSKKDMFPKKNAGLWKIFNDFQRHGILLHWHWIPRDTVELNAFADKISKEARKTVAKLRDRLEGEDTSPYTSNPSST